MENFKDYKRTFLSHFFPENERMENELNCQVNFQN